MPWYDRSKGVNFSNPHRMGRFKRIHIDANMLSEMYYKGNKIHNIAVHFKVSDATIKRHLKFIIPDNLKRNSGLTSNPNDTFNADIIKYYLNHHYSIDKIAILMGCSSEKIRTRLRKCGVKLRTIAYKNLLLMHPIRLNRKRDKLYLLSDLEEFNRCFKLMYCLDFNKKEIAKFLNIHEQTVIRRIKFLRGNNNFKLRVCKYCNRLFRFAATEKHKTSNVCQLCLSSLRNSASLGIPEEILTKIKEIDAKKQTNIEL